MLILKPLRYRSVAWLWGGQVFSSVGDEIHKVALVWLAAGLIGKDTGYLSALQAAAIFLFSIFGGLAAGRWTSRQTMIVTDLLRGLLVLIIPISFFLIGPNLWILGTVSFCVSGLTAFFEPPLRSMLPELVADEELLHASNGLMETTGRLGRIIGPGLIGVLNNTVPLIHYFTIDACSFFISAFSVARSRPKTNETLTNLTPAENFLSGVRAVKGHSLLQYLCYSNAFVNSAWYLVFPLTMGLYLHQLMPGNVGALGKFVAAYGVGNVLSNVIVGTRPLKNPDLLGFWGRLFAGLGFVGLSISPSLAWMMLAAAFAAIGGPMTDLGFLAVLQRHGHDKIASVIRLNLSVTYGSLLICMALSPTIFRMVSFPAVIAASGSIMVAVALIGFAIFGRN